jgi:hypothetical protein
MDLFLSSGSFTSFVADGMILEMSDSTLNPKPPELLVCLPAEPFSCNTKTNAHQ